MQNLRIVRLHFEDGSVEAIPERTIVLVQAINLLATFDPAQLERIEHAVNSLVEATKKLKFPDTNG